jgi:hypothetical protein
LAEVDDLQADLHSLKKLSHLQRRDIRNLSTAQQTPKGHGRSLKIETDELYDSGED